MLKRRSAVFIVPSETVGHDLIFRHYTKKVVVGRYSATKMVKATGKMQNKRLTKNSSQ